MTSDDALVSTDNVYRFKVAKDETSTKIDNKIDDGK